MEPPTPRRWTNERVFVDLSYLLRLGGAMSDEYQQRILNRIGKFYERTKKDKEHYEKEAARACGQSASRNKRACQQNDKSKCGSQSCSITSGSSGAMSQTRGTGAEGRRERFVGRGFERKGSSQESPTYSYSTRVRGRDVSVWRLSSSELKVGE